LGHSSKGKTCKTAAALGILITRGALKTCESCTIAKAKQKNMKDKSKGEKAVKYNGRVYHDIATVKESEEDKSLSRRTVWHIMAEETVNFKRSKLFVAKSNMPKDMCIFIKQEKFWASNVNHQAGQCRQEHETGHAGSFTRMEAGIYF